MQENNTNLEEIKNNQQGNNTTNINLEKFKTGYDASKYEKNIYEKWENSGYFNPDNLPKENIKLEKFTNETIDKDGNKESFVDLREKTFTCILPPPNVTGTLHTGHAIMLAIQDTVVRYKRMTGHKTLWLPGTDHAAIATQSKVEKELSKKGETRHSLGREVFLEKVNEFAMESQATILSQFRSMGASLDWSRLAFTLDETRNNAVNVMFAKMYNDGLIYKGHRIVNWDPKGQTTISDDELVMEDRKSILYTFKYGKDFPISISTTRPETKVGDTAVAVHPDDVRYAEYIGKEYEINFAGCPIKIKIIADKAVDKDFGTGALGVTPSHSQIDWEIADRHNLERKQVISEYAKMCNVENEELLGKKVLEAREYVVSWLKENDLMQEEKQVDQSVPTAERTGGIIEPLPKSQWFVAVNKEFEHFGKKTTLKELMHNAVAQADTKDAVENTSLDQIKMMPDRYAKVYHHWIDNLHDWCISRQIWYGHRVPVWYDQNDNIVTTGHITKEIEDKYKADNKMSELIVRQDEDTLDTWFSSGMWTFSTLGWTGDDKIDQDKLNDLNTYHPTDFMETGHDILFFWVARMIMMSTYALDKNPFKTVYLHGLIRDSQGRKMSKSLGNVLDPRDLTEKYGTDALRMSLIVGNGPGNDLKLAEDKIKAYKNFANKIWNATRFVLEAGEQNIYDENIEFTEADQEIYYTWKIQIQEITDDIENYRLHLASEKLYDYFWKTFCDVLIEDSKKHLNLFGGQASDPSLSRMKLLDTLLRENIIALHPFMPFVTEEIWTSIKKESDNHLLVTKWIA